jgi:hypothetical protein
VLFPGPITASDNRAQSLGSKRISLGLFIQRDLHFRAPAAIICQREYTSTGSEAGNQVKSACALVRNEIDT